MFDAFLQFCRSSVRCFFVFITISVVAQDAWNPAAETVVVFNPDFPESENLARYYATQRGIAEDHLLGIKGSKEEAVSREAFDETIAPAMRQAFIERDWFQLQPKDLRGPRTGKLNTQPVVLASKIKVLVLMHGVPSKIIRQKEQPKASQEDEASVDSELAALGLPVKQLAGATPNPFFDQTTRFNECRNVTGMLLVGRLDAATPELVRRMIDDAMAVEQTGLSGRAVIDLALKKGAYEEGEEWLRQSVQTYRRHGLPTYVDRYESLIRESWPLPDTVLYFGWYAGEASGALKPDSFRFKRGAVACHLHSFSASIIRTTTQAWVGPIIAHGAAATMGNVWEPYLHLTVHFDVVNDRLLKGWTLAEAAWCGTPGLSWMNVVIGDPLYRPFAKSPLGHDADRNYALYQGIAEKHADDKDSTALKQEVLKLAQKRREPSLIEFLALLSSNESKPGEAIELLQHARSLYADAADKLRTIIYEAELLHRDHDSKKDKEALALLQRVVADETMKRAPGFGAVLSMIKDVGG